MVEAFPEGSECHNALIVLALTGWRPAEIKEGAKVSLTEQGHRSVIIRGAKVTTSSGQSARRLWLKVDNPIAWRLLDAVEDNGFEHGLMVWISEPREFCDYVRRRSRRLFPGAGYVASPYSFRHGFAADQKAKKALVDELARMMGQSRIDRNAVMALTGKDASRSVMSWRPLPHGRSAASAHSVAETHWLFACVPLRLPSATAELGRRATHSANHHRLRDPYGRWQ